MPGSGTSEPAAQSTTALTPEANSTDRPRNGCGYADTAIGTFGTYLESKYGEIRGCGRFGDAILVMTLGLPGGDGVIAVHDCPAGVATPLPATPQSSVCLDPQDPTSGWTYIQPPYPGGVTPLTDRDSHTIFIDNGGHQLTFDFVTRQFGPG